MSETMYSLFQRKSARVGVERLEDERQHFVPAIRDERDDVLVVPEEERALGDLEVGRADAERDAREERLEDERELGRLHHLEDLLHLVEEEQLLGREGARPVLEDVQQHLLGER